jgi:hypothetical protein
MKLEELVNGIPGFSGRSHADKIKLFAWFLLSKRGRERFMPADIKACYTELGIDEPSSIAPFLTAMEKRKPREVKRDIRGYVLEKRIFDAFEAKYGQRPAAIQVDKLLTELPAKVPNLAERTFLDETLNCYKCKAFRAAIVMAWSLAYDHLCHYVLIKHLADFNAEWPVQFQKKHQHARINAVSMRDDFGELKESEVIQICRAANIITNDIQKVLKIKLDIRNTYAHPSSLSAAPQTAEEFIIDLVTNVVLKLI